MGLKVFDWEAELAKFQAVCPACSEVYELDEEVLFPIDGNEFIKLECPQCEHSQLFDI